MRDKINDQEFSDSDPGTGFADYLSDGVYFLLCVAAATAVCYILAPYVNPAWRLL